MSDPTSTVLSVYDCFSRGDIPGLLAHLHPGVRWDHGHRRTGVPYAAERTGHAEVVEFFDVLAAQLEIEQFELGAIAATGNDVFARVHLRGRNRLTGLPVDDRPEVHHWVVGADGRIVSLTHVVDWGAHEVAAPGAAAPGSVLRAAGDTLEVMASGGQFEVYTLRGLADSGPPPHRHPWREAYVGITGEVELVQDHASSVLRAGDFACVEAGMLHSFRIASDEASFLVITGGGAASVFFSDLDANVPEAPSADTLADLIEVARRNGLSSPLFDGAAA